MNDLEIIMQLLIIGSSVTLIIFILAKYNYGIKKAAIERGFNPNERKKKYTFMEIGCIVLSLGIGFGISSIFTTMMLPEDTFYFLVYATLFSCGGIGLMAAHFIRARFEKK
ncbi:hypothetical protein SYJ56_18695 [Algoriphagus sp. D3-2-R+10]|uniref:hypothetical protein n=1 Tax=Algoriphagus aurantiacus TaxID=3103948 RepID=UPI002B3A4D74|nr:hypothetical protein [Algoriphagus sp. D3-2-R+10]MEB2777350.1 hypothetical protein [Algoriphagus sp. D3-2-R+10]